MRTKEDRLVVPWVRNWTVKSGSLHAVNSYLEEIAAAFKSYGVRSAVGDQQSLASATQYLGERQIEYVRQVTNGAASEPVFDYLREQLRAGRLSLPDNDILQMQLKRLKERRDNGYEVAASRATTILPSRLQRRSSAPVSCRSGPRRASARFSRTGHRPRAGRR